MNPSAVVHARPVHGLHSDSPGAATTDGALFDHCNRLCHRRTQYRRILAWRRGGSFRRLGDRVVCAEIGAIAGNWDRRSALFLYAVGVQYGKQFFAGLTSVDGLRANLIALVGVLSAGAVSLLFIKTANLNTGYALGLFAGSGTSTPALQAAIATLGNDDPAVGYSVAYPFGVAGPILCSLPRFAIFLKPKFVTATTSGFELLEIALQRTGVFREAAW